MPTETNEDHVILVDDNDVQIGTMKKSEVHHSDTPLHRAFSVYVFNGKGEIFIQQRHKGKKTWGGFWSNSCCGHPKPGEERINAAQRRIKEETGIDVEDIELIEPYRYCFEHNGVVENEICPIFVCITKSTEVAMDENEIDAHKWMSWSKLEEFMQENSEIYSPWSKEQITILNNSLNFKNWLQDQNLTLS